jgi:hypothetical protein
MMPDVRGDVTAWFSRHLVALEVAYTVKHEKKPPEEARTYFTGFVDGVRSGFRGWGQWMGSGPVFGFDFEGTARQVPRQTVD